MRFDIQNLILKFNIPKKLNIKFFIGIDSCREFNFLQDRSIFKRFIDKTHLFYFYKKVIFRKFYRC